MIIKEHIGWSAYYMSLAKVSALRSKDPVTQTGACIVDKEGYIVSIGYNGFPRGCSDDEYPWNEGKNPLNSKHMYVVHAELNAILNAHGQDLHDCIMFATLFPCAECAKAIIQSGIKRVVYDDIKTHKAYTSAAIKMFKSANVETVKYIQEGFTFTLKV